MEKIVRKNESYSKLMLTEGATKMVDEDLQYEMKLPEWFDKKKIKMGQRFFLLNINAMSRAAYFGLLAVVPIETFTQVLISSKQSSTPALAYRRFKVNILHMKIWHENSIKPGSLAWQSLNTIRIIHVMINKRAINGEIGIISHKDMAIAQFLFMGFALLMPDMFGIEGTYQQFDAFNHFWRVIVNMLGTDDRFNCCGETVEETRSRLQAIKEDMLLPAWKDPFPACLPYYKVTFDALWHFDPTLHYESSMFMIKRAIGLPGYYYYDSESSESKDENMMIFDSMSLYTKIRIFVEVMMFEYLSHMFIFRWIFNFFRLLIALFEAFPFLALISFGKKYAFVNVMKSRK